MTPEMNGPAYKSLKISGRLALEMLLDCLSLVEIDCAPCPDGLPVYD
jgi:hypothetical protein